jgi:hypothetical protein
MPQVREEASPVVAEFGYRYFKPPAYWGDLGNHKAGDPWLIHTAPAQVLQATVESVVGGYKGCIQHVGVLLRIAPGQAKAFAAVRARYFVATPTPGEKSRPTRLPSSIRTLPADALTPHLRRSIESVLRDGLVRELPRIRTEAGPLPQIDEALEQGHAQLQYNVQAFHLSPDRVPVLFVRAEWLVGRRQAFAAALWVRGGQQMEVLETNEHRAEWLRVDEADGAVSPAHLGLVLNVLDRDGDGWGEVLFAVAGYESYSVALLEYSAEGFIEETAIGGGC